MNFDTLIWGTASSGVPALMVLFSIYMILDILRTLFKDGG